MDGKGIALDNIYIEHLWKNVKYEDMYLHTFEEGIELYEGPDKCFRFYNQVGLHQSLNDKTSESLYLKAA